MDRHRTQINFELIGEPDGQVDQFEVRQRPAPLVPTEAMREAKTWLESIRYPPVPDRDFLAMHGWLSPTGELFACGWEQHNELTRALGFAHESAIEAAGYCKLSQLRWLVQSRYCEKSLTAAQWETIERWYEKNGFPDEHFMRLSALVEA